MESFVRDGSMQFSHARRDDWILEYRFGSAGEWTASEEAEAANLPMNVHHVTAPLGALSGDEAVLEIRIR